ncbi:MAG: ParM/StbA family protein [Eubacteriales bacterium]
MIISIDHGYGLIKTPHFSFKTGITEYDNEPYTSKNVVKYNGKYYVCGSGRQSLVRDKTVDDSYYILTLMAIAKEIEHRGLNRRAEITIAAGLPLTSYGRDKEKFIQYLKRSAFQPVKFSFENKDYRIEIARVLLYPQGYSAVIEEIPNLKNEPSIIVCDVGSWTVDVMRLDNGVPNADTCRSLELGTIRMVDEILEQVRRVTGLSITSSQVEQLLSGKDCSMDIRAKEIVIDQGKTYIDRLIRSLLEAGFDTSAVPIIFIGGGSSLIRENIGNNKICSMTIVDDICANAKGYEKIAMSILNEG